MSVKVYIGPMWSGKTSAMCGEIERYHYARKKCIIIKYAKDTRYNHLSKSGGIMTHRGDEYSKVQIVETENLSDVVIGDDIAAVGIDEAQFYPNAAEWIKKLAAEGKHVVVAALDSTWQMKSFGKISEIIAVSDNVQKLNAVCMKCGADAPFTAKIAGNNEVEEIGGKDKYIAVCRKCFEECSQ